MSRIGKKPVPVPGTVKVNIAGKEINVSGPKGQLGWTLPGGITAELASNEVVVSRANDQKSERAFHGLSRSLIANMVKGVAEGYEIKLEVYGTGYSVDAKGDTLLLNCGYMGRGVGKKAQFEIPIPAEITVAVQTPVGRGNNEPARFSVSGCDKQKVGQFASEVRALRKPEPYLGKGIRYAGEQIRRKVGKVFAGGG